MSDMRPRTVALNRWTLLAFVVFCAVFAFWMTGSGPYSIERYLDALLVSMTVYGAALVSVFVVANIASARLLPRVLALGSAALFGVFAGHFMATSGWGFGQAQFDNPWRLLASPLSFLGIAWLGVAWILMAEREADAREAVFKERMRELQLRRATNDARYSLLQSQVEPHFLFNTLAHVRRLYEINPAAGREMLGNLRRYLGDARPAIQRDSIALEEDARLAAAYLNLQQVRMGDRLRFVFELPPESRRALVPPMTLTTLVENAVRHGLSPMSEGGEIRVCAQLVEGSVRIEVTDTGRGIASGHGSGTGLANLRARLEALYGSEANLSLTAREPRGATASVWVPTGVSGLPA